LDHSIFAFEMQRSFCCKAQVEAPIHVLNHSKQTKNEEDNGAGTRDMSRAFLFSKTIEAKLSLIFAPFPSEAPQGTGSD